LGALNGANFSGCRQPSEGLFRKGSESLPRRLNDQAVNNIPIARCIFGVFYATRIRRTIDKVEERQQGLMFSAAIDKLLPATMRTLL
jgi:hypothetical protein